MKEGGYRGGKGRSERLFFTVHRGTILLLLVVLPSLKAESVSHLVWATCCKLLLLLCSASSVDWLQANRW